MRNGLTYEDLGQRAHLWYHAVWFVNWWAPSQPTPSDIGECTHAALCRDISARAARDAARLERLRHTTYEKNRKKWSTTVRTLQFLAEVAHAEADAIDIFSACFQENRRLNAVEQERRRGLARARARELADHVRAGRARQITHEGDGSAEWLALAMLAEERAA